MTTAVATIAVLGMTFGAAGPAQAAVGMYYVSSNWWQSYAAVESTGGPGVFQARALLGGTNRWGVRSRYSSHAQVEGYSWTHNAWLYLDGSVWKRAQG